MADPVFAIVGAGMGGLTAAATLAAVGVEVHVFEQADRFGRVGAGIQISPNAFRVLRRCGVEDALRNVATRPNVLRNVTWDTDRQLAEIALGDTLETAQGAPYLVLHRADLHSVLASMVPASTVHLGKRLRDLRTTGDGVELQFDDGTAFRADAVVGADGVHSRVHDIVFGATPPRYAGRVAYRTVFDSSLISIPISADPTKWWGPDRHFVVYAITHGTEVYFVTSVPEDEPCVESWSSVGDLKALRAAFDGFSGRVRTVLAACPAAHGWGIYIRDPLPTWHDGPITLLGDSCHPMTPYMAQGAGMAIEDAAILARCVEASTGNLERAFARYEMTRMARTARVQRESEQNPLIGSRDLGWLYGYDVWTEPLAGHDTEAVMQQTDAHELTTRGR